jgi:hypothetical protein
MRTTRIKRVGLSFACSFVSELFLVCVIAAVDGSGASSLPAGIFAFSIFVIPGWLLSLPLVIMFDRADGWRLWVLGAYGILLGPAVIFVWAVACNFEEGTPISSFMFGRICGMALLIALTSTTLYLGLLRYFSCHSIEQAQS